MKFFLFDPMMNSGAGGYVRPTSLKPAASLDQAKCYRRRHAAIEAASLSNVSRNVPPGREGDRHYQNLPNVVVHEYDDTMNLVATHAAPPTYLVVEVEGNEVKSITPLTLTE